MFQCDRISQSKITPIKIPGTQDVRRMSANPREPQNTDYLSEDSTLGNCISNDEKENVLGAHLIESKENSSTLMFRNPEIIVTPPSGNEKGIS